jgi:hypothetical protein
LTHPSLLSQELLDSIKPSQDELSGLNGLASSPTLDLWNLSLTTQQRSPTVVVRLQGSSDGVTPQNTLSSSVRAIMGSLDQIYSPSLGLVVPIPDPPCFLIGVYKYIFFILKWHDTDDYTSVLFEYLKIDRHSNKLESC